MTGADLLDRMTAFDNELEVEANGDDETRALLALDAAQDYMEDVAASMPRIGMTAATIATVAGQEHTTWPTGLLRVDSVWLLDSNGKQVRELDPTHDSGGHAPSTAFPWNLLAIPSSPGAPWKYSYDEEKFYWQPTPDAAYTLRVFGLRSRTDLTDRTVTFGWANSLSLPLCSFAVRLLEMGIDDPSDELNALAEQTFVPALRRLRKPVRSTPMSRHYTRTHTT